ncbi:hypothetical protein VPH35_012345 [Triticum aestivum]|uniref:Uncharacterized protein n=2 Tax=Aegilops tauschii TaxID=37682 RepID=A0A452XKU7_AEGTS|nr:thionin isoform X1 [Aegilops tauschii subsp. strangulata]XP_044436203.1 thionin-like isoform X1 [Triticum aestivum]XP_044436217.1 thionin-like isoform X1 [Triticum aestivum]
MVMRGGKSSVKTMAVMLAVVGLVALQQTQRVQASVCCCLDLAVPVYYTCRGSSGTMSQCCPTCGGYVSVGGCRPPYVPISGYRTTAVNYCKLGCTASVCNKLIPSAVVGSGNEGKDAMERCTSGCHDLCTKSSTDIAKVHNA